jgi:LPS-assembly protein
LAFSTSHRVAVLRENPLIGILHDRQEIRGQATVALSENWKVAGRVIYDIHLGSFVRQGVGLAYGDECIDVSLTYNEACAFNEACGFGHPSGTL